MAKKTDAAEGGGRLTLVEAIAIVNAAIASAEMPINECSALLLTAPAAVKKAGNDALTAISKAKKKALGMVHDQARQRKSKGYGAVNTSKPPEPDKKERNR